MSFWQKLFGKKSNDAPPSNSEGGEDIISQLHLVDGDGEKIKALSENVVVGKLLELNPHPDPEITKVRVTQTDVGGGQVETILCGGANLEQGHIVAVAKVGAVLPGDFEIGVRAIRNVESHGMICARKELGISPQDEEEMGIWVLPSGLEEKLGTPVRDLV